jgi:hypothetical protein
VEYERRHRDAREVGPRIREELELEERGRDVGIGGAALVTRERADLVAARVGNDQPGEHLGRERPVDPREVDERAARRLRQVVARYEAAEEHDTVDHFGRLAREPGGVDRRARAGEHRHGLPGARLDDGPERARVELDRCGRGKVAIESPAPRRS